MDASADAVGPAPSTHGRRDTPALLPRGPTRPHAAPHGGRTDPRPVRAHAGTCDLGDERFRHQRHVGCEAPGARLRSAAVRALPRDPGSDPRG